MADSSPTEPPALIDLQQIDGAFRFEEGFSRPDWRLISKTIRKSIDPPDLNTAWNEAARQWIRQLQSDLGGNYQCAESQRFLLIAALDAETRAQILAFAEKTLDRIRERLQDAAWKPKHGKHVILLFAEQDDYYQYVSYYYRDGNHPTSGGCLIHRDYVHIAIPYEPSHFRMVLTHELTHNCVVHLLHLPLWLNEGLATTFERTVNPTAEPLLDYELKERHLSFWNQKTIQEFWAGVSFGKPGDSNELSYSLAEIILNLLLEHQGDWGAFIRNADQRDGGQTAAMDFLGFDLGNIMATFLGKGDWRPRRKEMVALWETKKKEGVSKD